MAIWAESHFSLFLSPFASHFSNLNLHFVKIILSTLHFQAILMDTNCSMKTRSYSTQGTYYQGENMDQEYDEYD